MKKNFRLVSILSLIILLLFSVTAQAAINHKDASITLIPGETLPVSYADCNYILTNQPNPVWGGGIISCYGSEGFTVSFDCTIKASNAIPEINSNTYSVGIMFHVDYSITASESVAPGTYKLTIYFRNAYDQFLLDQFDCFVTIPETPTTTTPVQETKAPVVTEAPAQEINTPVVIEAPDQETAAPTVTEAPAQETNAPVVTEAPVQKTATHAVTETPAQAITAPVATEIPVRETATPVTSAPESEHTTPVVSSEPAQDASVAAAPASATVSGLKYSLNNSKKTATFVGAENKKVTNINIPDTIKVSGVTYKVTKIKANACKKLTKLTKVTIGKNVSTIGKNAFNGCSKLKTITIKSTKLTSGSVGSGAFKGIAKKATVKVPSSKYKTYQALLLKKGVPQTAALKK